MIDAQRAALSTLKFNAAPTPDDVWKASAFHVAGVHERTVQEIFDGVVAARRDEDSSPIGVVVQGQAGAGKTHMLGEVRQHIQRVGGYFFLVGILSGKTFWQSTSLAVVEGLGRDAGNWPTQLKAFLRRLTSQVALPEKVRDAIAGDTDLQPADVDAFITALRSYSPQVGRECQATARALVLYGARDFALQDIGFAYLSSLEVTDAQERATWRLPPGARTPQLVVRDISRLLALTNVPTVIAIDQLDTLFAQYTGATDERAPRRQDPRVAALVGEVADGLMNLRETTRRTLTVVACIPVTWQIIKHDAAAPVRDRFREAEMLDRVPDAQVGEALIRKRLEVHYGAVGFTPPYPTWPVRPEAFQSAHEYTPRRLLKVVEEHVTACLRTGQVVEMTQLDASTTVVPKSDMPPDAALILLDKRFAKLRADADVAHAMQPTTEDQVMPALLAAGLRAWIDERGGTGVYAYDPPPATKPALHARLRQTLDERVEDELHWGFRAITASNAMAVISRIRNAATATGLDVEVPKRKIVLLRNSSWGLGPATREVIASFRTAGGITRSVSDADLRTFAALQALLAEEPAELRPWLVTRLPATQTELFQAVFGDRAGAVDPAGHDPVAPSPVSVVIESPSGRTDADIPLGVGMADGSPFRVELESLRKHTVIFAGSGSGKTVLIRRLVEECALQGVSAIVLDPNNDLARLGDPWPQPPSQWTGDDQRRSAEYLAQTDVVIWTPRRDAGRPLSFQPLPDFSLVRDERDEFQAALDVAVAALAPRARTNGATAKATQGQAVLREALRYYAHKDLVGLRQFIGVLAALPDGVSTIGKASKLAAEMADTLSAAMEIDPLFGGEGTAVDPGLLLTPPPGKRARVSVISFVGLTSDAQRQGFVNQLQMALFAWIKRNPAGDRPLGGLFVMDEAQTLAPSGAQTACTASTLALVSQARKYGLGLVFATQAPRGLHHYIPGNSATQFFGLLNSPAAIGAAKDMAQNKGGQVPDIALLTSGQFYAAREGHPFQKIRTPLCLSHHPRSPLTAEEVIDRAGHLSGSAS
jgi:hypothetical protein